MKIFVATPVYDGKLPVQTVLCLLEEQLLAAGVGDELFFNFLPSCSVPAHGRNRLVNEFLKSNCEKLIFLDADVTFKPGDLIRLAHLPVEVVGGAYRLKQETEEYPVGFLDNKTEDRLGLISVETIPTGFVSFSRSVFEKFKEHFKDREYQHGGERLYCFFQMVFADGKMHSDDSYFCKEWKKIGGKVYLNPNFTLTHWDFHVPYVGQIKKWLKAKQLKETA